MTITVFPVTRVLPLRSAISTVAADRAVRLRRYRRCLCEIRGADLSRSAPFAGSASRFRAPFRPARCIDWSSSQGHGASRPRRKSPMFPISISGTRSGGRKQAAGFQLGARMWHTDNSFNACRRAPRCSTRVRFRRLRPYRIRRRACRLRRAARSNETSARIDRRPSIRSCTRAHGSASGDLATKNDAKCAGTASAVRTIPQSAASRSTSLPMRGAFSACPSGRPRPDR